MFCYGPCQYWGFLSGALTHTELDLSREKKLMFMTSASGAVRKGMTSLFLNSSVEWMRKKKNPECFAAVHHVHLWQEVGTCRVGEIPPGLSQTAGTDEPLWPDGGDEVSILVQLCCHRVERVLACVFGFFWEAGGGVHMWNRVRVRGGHILDDKFNHFLSHKQSSDSFSIQSQWSLFPRLLLMLSCQYIIKKSYSTADEYQCPQ